MYAVFLAVLISCGGKSEPVDTSNIDTDVADADTDTDADADTDSDTDTDTDSDTDTDTDSDADTDTDTTPPGILPIGDPCSDDNQCATGVCWDFSDYDPLCFGAVCSDSCITHQDCINAFNAAGAPFPQGATCGLDGRCDPVSSGFGAFACAR